MRSDVFGYDVLVTVLLGIVVASCFAVGF